MSNLVPILSLYFPRCYVCPYFNLFRFVPRTFRPHNHSDPPGYCSYLEEPGRTIHESILVTGECSFGRVTAV